MLTWLPPSPPPSDAEDDIYYDPTGEYWFEQLPMSESRLPSTIHELHRPRPLAPVSTTVSERFVPEIVLPVPSPYQILPSPMPPIVAMPPSPTGMCTVASGIVRDIVSSPSASLTSSVSHERVVNFIPQAGASSGAPYLDTSNLLRPATPSHLPGSVDDTIDSVRKSAQKALAVQGAPRALQTVGGRANLPDVRNGKSELRRPFTPPPRQREAADYDGPEWSIAEDHTALSILTNIEQLPSHLHSTRLGIYANWDVVSFLLATCPGFYRSPRQCSLHYQMVVQPREEGRMVTLDPITKKTKRVPLSSAEMIHMKRGRTKTDQQYFADAFKLFANRFVQKTKVQRMATMKHTTTFQRSMSGGAVGTTLGSPPHSQQMRLAEFGVRYGSVAAVSDVADSRSERVAKMREQDRERLRLKEEEEQKREAMVMEQQRNHDQRVVRKEPAVAPLPGIIHYQKVSFGSILEHAQQQLASITAPPVSAPTVPTVRSYASGSYVQGPIVTNIPGSSSAYASDTAQVIVGQRAYIDHPSVAVSGLASGAHQIGTRRVAIPVGSGTPTQHQIVMTSGAQVGSSGGQQPYAVVVTSQENISGQQLGGRFQYTTRQEGGMGERQTVYRTIPPSATKRAISASAAQRIAAGYGTSEPQQIYATTSHGGRTLIMSQGDGSQLGDSGQIQMIRPQMQASGISMRQEVRPKIAQRAPQSRLFVTTTSGDRTYLMQQQQVRMMPGGQRIAQKRTTGTALHAKTVGGQQQVTMMLPSRGGTVQQIRTIPRNISYQSSRVPSIGLVMSGNSRSNETIGGSGTTKQLPTTSGISRQSMSGASPSARQVTVSVQGIASSSASSILQDHPISVPAQQTQYLPPITLSNQSPMQARYLTTANVPAAGNAPSGDGTTTGMQSSGTDMP